MTKHRESISKSVPKSILKSSLKYEAVIARLEKSSTPSILKTGYEIDTVRRFLEYIGSPQEGIKMVHIGGTAGKGSTAAFISALLEEHGIKAGLFTSPHIASVRERIRIGREEISKKDFCTIINQVLNNAEEFCSIYKTRKLTYFELLLAAALWFFKQKGIKDMIIEVGLGGMLDPTNVLDGDVVVLTNVGLDHTEILGDTVEKIARDKVGIIKKNCICVSGFKQDSVKRVLRERCKSNDIKILLSRKDFDCNILDCNLKGSLFNYSSNKLSLKDIKLSVIGTHQIENACLALTAFIEYADLRNFQIKRKKIFRALKNVKIAGRIEIKSREPLIIWDGAHNEDKMAALAETLDRFTKEEVYLLFAFKKGQDFHRLIPPLSILRHRIREVVLTKYKLKQDVHLESEPVKNFLNDLKKTLPKAKITFIPNTQLAYESLLKKLDRKNNEGDNKKNHQKRMVVVTGSFYLLASISD